MNLRHTKNGAIFGPPCINGLFCPCLYFALTARKSAIFIVQVITLYKKITLPYNRVHHWSLIGVLSYGSDADTNLVVTMIEAKKETCTENKEPCDVVGY